MVGRGDERQPLMSDPERHSADDVDVDVDADDTDNTNNGAGDEQSKQQHRIEIREDHPDAPVEDASGSGSGHGADLELDDSTDPPTPRFIQDEGSWKHWKWVPYPVRRAVRAVIRWSRGPPDARPYHITPLFPAVQEYPLWLVDKLLSTRRRRAWAVLSCGSIWLIAFVLVKRQESISTEIAGWGRPASIGCGVTYWSSGNGCGLDGNECRPFSDSGFAFRCSANCESYHVLNPRAVGDLEVIYEPMVIGGPGTGGESSNATYRGDSFICGAAVHAGIISNGKGGCGVVELVGQQEDFESTNRNGIKSIPFPSYFPLSFRFVNDIKCKATDMRWSLLALSTVFTGVLSLATASPALFFFPTFVGIFWTVGMALDPPSSGSVATLFSTVLGSFLPAMFCAWVMYDKMGVRRTLRGLTAQIEKTILWLGPCWVGAMTNYTLDFIPIQRLTGHDLDQQPGAKAALAIIVIVLAAIIGSQVWFFRQEGRFIKYIQLYALFIGAIIIALLLPGLDLRIHHYILALLLLPGTSMQTRPCLIYQGLLVGLFINGIARWNFDSVLQTPAALQGDATKGTALPVIPSPIIDLANSTGGTSNITFTWKPPPTKRYDGISILVNDVERFRSYFDDGIGQEDKFVWGRNSSLDLPEYFRFAFMDGSDSGDYTKAGTWTSDGEWTEMKAGPSRVKVRNLEGEMSLRRH